MVKKRRRGAVRYSYFWGDHGGHYGLAINLETFRWGAPLSVKEILFSEAIKEMKEMLLIEVDDGS